MVRLVVWAGDVRVFASFQVFVPLFTFWTLYAAHVIKVPLSIATDALVGLVEVGLLSWTLAGQSFRVESEASWAAVALKSLLIEEVRSRTSNAGAIGALVRLLLRTSDVGFGSTHFARCSFIGRFLDLFLLARVSGSVKLFIFLTADASFVRSKVWFLSWTFASLGLRIVSKAFRTSEALTI